MDQYDGKSVRPGTLNVTSHAERHITLAASVCLKQWTSFMWSLCLSVTVLKQSRRHLSIQTEQACRQARRHLSISIQTEHACRQARRHTSRQTGISIQEGKHAGRQSVNSTYSQTINTASRYLQMIGRVECYYVNCKMTLDYDAAPTHTCMQCSPKIDIK